ncbi:MULTISPECIES: hypothetical protein [Pantoea]|uniref:Uncharacterized protein n=2 Tax=Pantoea stewartii TaxID=66269 RepID=H3RHV4_PANSE|nr:MULTISPECIES: hypothetical protein [Pantoea]ARF48164.1 hypothetical protein DSJ_01380 [Pantoea stewartii subsp. stewartii DC283]EHT99049.1 hypothetical protein CKS_0957 [Pantoea stewartii subsp. stewartii DC283]KAB0555251.1 hypothetical protein F7Q90_09815 [Pantoea stewartii subsp. stewartii]KGD84658.1 hypothetical protein HA47_05085 [Pantoea stewartii subsp. indologenes]KHE02931.1 hypothetical protein NL54_02740 [Pantoea stewartii]
MGTAIFMVLMVSGYWYTSRDLSSRFKMRRTSGWDVYFLVALYGCIFVLQGVFATAFIWFVLFIISSVSNALYIFPGDHLQLQMKFMNWSFLGIQAPVVIMLTFAILFCLYRSNWAGSARLNVSGRKDLYQKLSRSNGVEQMLFQCMEEGELAWITLKSRRIYIGMVHAATFEYESTANIVLIPMLSGYRDSHTLKLAVEHNYSSWYAEHGITLDSEPKNAMAFRKVIMLDQIESFSLFDPASATALAMGEDHPQSVEKSRDGNKSSPPDQQIE